MNLEEIRSEIESILDDHLRNYERVIRREIDVSTCGTKRDSENLREAMVLCYESQEKAIGRLLEIIKGKTK